MLTRQLTKYWWILAAVLVPVGLLAQGLLPRPIKRFQVPDYYPSKPGQTNRLKSLVIGEEATPQVAGSALTSVLIKGLRLINVREDGVTNLVAEAKRCKYSDADRCVTSDDDLQIKSGDGKLFIEGRGFLWRQTNQSLVISNQVHTLIRQETNIDITATSFSYNPSDNQIIYQDNVRVRHPDWEFSCRRLTAVLTTNSAARAGSVDRMIAEGNVRLLDQVGKGQLAGDLLEYTLHAGKEKVVITGNSQWQMDLRKGQADQFVLERAVSTPQRVTYAARGHTSTQIPSSETLGTGWFVLNTNNPAPPDKSKPTWLTITADESIITTDKLKTTATNSASSPQTAFFHGHVRASEDSTKGPPASLTCDQLRVFFGGTNQQIESASFEGNVQVEQDQNQVTAQRGIFRQSTQTTEFIGLPKWRSGTNEGSADRLLIDQARKSLLASSNAIMTIALSASSSSVFPVFNGTQPAPSTNVTERRLEIRCQNYELSPEKADFLGPVTTKEFVSGVLRSRMTSQKLFVKFLPGNQIEYLKAETNVVVGQYRSATPEESRPDQELRCEVMTAEASQGRIILLVADHQVRVQGTNNKGGPFLASGDSLVYRVLQGQMELRGNPEILLPEGRFSAPLILWDQKLNTLFCPKDWRITSASNWMVKASSAKKSTPPGPSKPSGAARKKK
jgi:lipopolysaccharide export system protein LptA